MNQFIPCVCVCVYQNSARFAQWWSTRNTLVVIAAALAIAVLQHADQFFTPLIAFYVQQQNNGTAFDLRARENANATSNVRSAAATLTNDDGRSRRRASLRYSDAYTLRSLCRAMWRPY